MPKNRRSEQKQEKKRRKQQAQRGKRLLQRLGKELAYAPIRRD